MNPEHDRNLRLSVAILELLQTFLRNGNVEVQTPELIVARSWIIRPSTNKDFTLLLDTSRAEHGRIERIWKKVLHLAVGPSFVDRRVGNTAKVGKTVDLVIFANYLTPQGWEILRDLHFKRVCDEKQLLLANSRNSNPAGRTSVKVAEVEL